MTGKPGPAAMSAEDVVAWQWRIKLSSGWTCWDNGGVGSAPPVSKFAFRDREQRNLVPLSTLTASQARYERLRGLVEEAAGSLRGLYKHHKCQVGIASEITFDEMAAEGHGCAMQAYKNAADLVDTLLADGGEANDNEVEG